MINWSESNIEAATTANILPDIQLGDALKLVRRRTLSEPDFEQIMHVQFHRFDSFRISVLSFEERGE